MVLPEGNFLPLLQSLQASKDWFLKGLACCSSAASHTLGDTNVSSGSSSTQPSLRASCLGPPPTTWRATDPRRVQRWKYPTCRKGIRARGSAACTAQKADWEQWNTSCRSQVPSVPHSHPIRSPGVLSSLSLTLSSSPLVPSWCHAAFAPTSYRSGSFQLPAPFSSLPVFAQSRTAKSPFPTYTLHLTTVPPHRCPSLQPCHPLQRAGYFGAHARAVPPAYSLPSGSGPTKKGKCPSLHSSGFSGVQPVFDLPPGYRRDSSEMSQGHGSQGRTGLGQPAEAVVKVEWKLWAELWQVWLTMAFIWGQV